MALYDSSHHLPGSQPLPLATLFALLHIFVHGNLNLLLLSPEHQLRSRASAIANGNLPLPYSALFGVSAIAPVLSLSLRHSWLDVVWWSAAILVTWLIYNGQQWVQEENASIANLEKMRYTAKGA